MKKWIYIFFSFLILHSSVTNVQAADEHIYSEWKSNNKGWWYVNTDGSYPVNTWQKINNTWYHFDANGYMQTGWFKEGNTWYYLNTSGAMAVGWKKINNTWYFFRAGGSMVTGWQKISNEWYYFTSSGAMKTGWLNVNNTWYYMNSSGAMLTGWQTINNKQYYMSDSGAMVTGIQTIDGIKYQFDSSGAFIGKVDEGEWKKINNQWYYYKDDAYATGWKKISGKWYYFNGKGVMQTGWKYIANKWYYFESSGAMKTGWLKYKQFWYYMDASGAMVSDKTMTINGKSYEFLSNGIMYDKDLVISEAKKLVGQPGECVRMAYELTKNALGMGASTLIIEEDNYCGTAHQVSASEARAGDLIIFRSSDGFIPHVGVFLDGYSSFQGNWLQEDGSRKAVITDYSNSCYYDDPDYVTEFWRIDTVYPDYVFIEDE